jgi:hypothetical protein
MSVLLKKKCSLDIQNVDLALTYCHPEMKVSYSSESQCGNGQILDIGHLKVPFEVLTVTTLMWLSAPGWTSVMTAVGQ